MSPYKRAKREDVVKSEHKELSIHIGSVNDSFESLQAMCNDKSNELLKSIELSVGEEMEVVFWTSDFPELIGVSKFTKNESGLLTFSLDYSLTTL